MADNNSTVIVIVLGDYANIQAGTTNTMHLDQVPPALQFANQARVAQLVSLVQVPRAQSRPCQQPATKDASIDLRETRPARELNVLLRGNRILVTPV